MAKRKRLSDKYRTYDLKRRIHRVWAMATDDQIERGLQWYGEAHGIAEEIGDDLGLDARHGAGMLAALSPMVYWEQNVKDARVLALDSDATVSTFNDQKRKALKIKRGDDPESVLKGPKVRAFWKCILEPKHPEAVVVDRHAGRVAVGWGMSIEEINYWIPKAGMREKITTAYQQVADELGLLPLEVQAVTWLVYREKIETPF